MSRCAKCGGRWPEVGITITPESPQVVAKPKAPQDSSLPAVTGADQLTLTVQRTCRDGLAIPVSSDARAQFSSAASYNPALTRSSVRR